MVRPIFQLFGGGRNMVRYDCQPGIMQSERNSFYQFEIAFYNECLSALKSVANIHKPFEKTFMDAMKLFMAIPERINFLQLGRYGRFSEQTYRNLFENETFDWFAFNDSIISKHLTGKRKAIAIDPSYIPKSGKKTPWIGYFWSGCAGDYKLGKENRETQSSQVV